ncbi:NUDIX domain-containing protein [Paenibacillus senegalensis]|uniref:NUDIX domain-containing protein n=1 Tax=Paenibacillus senegalensis TaxID=1465766 RepID=UPI000287FAC0|nr:NUDIX domain-containing protein [Paenibacillus senegalensis]
MGVTFRHVTRALILDQEKLLIARMKGAHSFLPGGEIERGEGAQSALKRELQEELGVGSCEIVRFMGVVEFGIKEKNYCEINHLFEVKCSELTSGRNPEALESHLEFFWLEPTLDNLRKYDVLPYLVQEMIPEVLQKQQPMWVSNM